MSEQDFYDEPERWWHRLPLYLLTREWWAYVLDDSRSDHGYGPFYGHIPRLRWRDERVNYPWVRPGNWLARFICRWRGHPAGVWWYSHGYGPDMHCKGCGEDLG